VNVIAPGVVDTPLHKNNPKEFPSTLSPLEQISDAKEIAEAAAIIPNMNQDTFDRLTQDAEQNYPISRVLKAKITLDARLV
jgi:organic hydroperoxide reductase OsmC/OhrA